MFVVCISAAKNICGFKNKMVLRDDEETIFFDRINNVLKTLEYII